VERKAEKKVGYGEHSEEPNGKSGEQLYKLSPAASSVNKEKGKTKKKKDTDK